MKFQIGILAYYTLDVHAPAHVLPFYDDKSPWNILFILMLSFCTQIYWGFFVPHIKGLTMCSIYNTRLGYILFSAHLCKILNWKKKGMNLIGVGELELISKVRHL